MKHVIIDPYKAYTSPSEWIGLDKAPGRTSARQVKIYPPGTAEIALGQKIAASDITTIVNKHKAGAVLEGLDPYALRILVTVET